MGGMADHKNGDGLDNNWDNLRPCSYSQNSQNRRRGIRNTSGFKGVTSSKRRWKALIDRGDRSKEYLGTFLTRELAARAYDDAAKKRYGEFALLNFPA